MWDFFGRWFARKAAILPPPQARVGRNATPDVLLRLFELFPDHPTIGVIDDRHELVAVLEVTRVKSALARGHATTVADLLS